MGGGGEGEEGEQCRGGRCWRGVEEGEGESDGRGKRVDYDGVKAANYFS